MHEKSLCWWVLKPDHQEGFLVQITVSLTVDLPATADVNMVEPHILDAGRQAMREALRLAALHAQAQVERCPACDHPILHADGTDRRVVLASFGRVEVPVLRKRCAACAHRFRASAAFFAPLDGANVTAELGRQAAAAGAAAPFARAAHMLHEQAGAPVSPETVRQQTIRHGATVAQQHGQVAERLLAPTAAEVRAEREAILTAPLAPPAAPPSQLLVELDGGWIASRDQAGGMEGKVAVVATGVERLSPDRQRLAPRRYVATFGSADQVGALTYAAVEALGASESPRQVVLGDGAAWIKTQANWHFPDAVKILDWSHLERTVHKAIRTACPGKALRDVRRALYQTVDGQLWQGAVDAALATLRTLQPAAPADPLAAVTDAISYVDSQREWIGDYGQWVAAGYPIGSGGVERAVEVVINRRMKKQGMRWKRANADAVVALRVEMLNQAWDEATVVRKLAA